MDKGNTETSISLEKWNSGDRKGLNTLIARDLDFIRRYVHSKLSAPLRQKAETGDIVQDAMLQFLRYGPRIHLSDKQHFRALLCRIIGNVIKDKYDWFCAKRRAMAREKPLSSDSILDLDPPQGATKCSPSQLASHNERESWIRLGLELLEPDERAVIILRDWEKRTFAKIAEEFGYSEDTAQRRYTKALASLAEKVIFLRTGNIEDLLDVDEDSSTKGTP